MIEKDIIEFIDYKRRYYSLDDLWTRAQNERRDDKTHGGCDDHPIAATWKPEITAIALPGRRLADRIRFLAGIATTLGGAGVLLSDLIALIPPLG